MSEEVIKHSVHTLVFRSLKRSHDMFLSNQSLLPPLDEKAEEIRRKVKIRDSFGQVMDAVQRAQAVKQHEALARPDTPHEINQIELAELSSEGAVVPYVGPGTPVPAPVPPSGALMVPRKAPAMPKPKWHAPWKLFRVISGHLGWVRCVAVEPGNEWFATGAADRVIKIWDLASGKLKVSLTGHVSTVRGLQVSSRHPYLFSCGEDRQVKCWDLEYNKWTKCVRSKEEELPATEDQHQCTDLTDHRSRVIRHYHGHLSAVHAISLHPALDIVVTGGRDAVARVWDLRTKANVHTFSGHTDTIAALVCQAAEPQVITSSHDTTIRLWDLAAGKSMCTLTNHKKSVRALVVHPTLYTFASASPDNIKQWKCPEGKFIQNLSGHNAIVNSLAVNPEGVLVSGGDNGTMFLWDWRTGYNFQRLQAAVQPGSMDSEAGVFAMTFDQSGTRLLTAEADKTIKIYKEDETASEETHPINWRPEILKRRKF